MFANREMIRTNLVHLTQFEEDMNGFAFVHDGEDDQTYKSELLVKLTIITIENMTLTKKTLQVITHNIAMMISYMY